MCICARLIGDEERAAILQRKEEYLAKDQVAAISTMKERLRNSREPELSFQSACEELRTQIEAQKTNEWRMNKLMQDLDEAGDGEVVKHRKRLGQIEAEQERLGGRIKKLETSDSASTPDNNIPLAKKRRDECEKKLEVASESYNLARQRDVLVGQLKRIENRALTALRDTIRTGTNERLKSLVQMEQLRINKIDGAISLTSDRVAERKDISEGQSLSVAYAFLTSLLSEAPFELPFIVDSPAVSLDLDVRREVGRIIPDLFDQMIMFVLSSEQAGFSETFYERDDTCFVSLSKAPGGGIQREYGREAFKRLAEEGGCAVSLRLPKGAAEFFKHIPEYPSQLPGLRFMDIDKYYACLMLGIKAGELGEEDHIASSSFLAAGAGYPEAYKAAADLIAGLLVDAEMRRNNVNANDRDQIESETVRLLQPRSAHGVE